MRINKGRLASQSSSHDSPRYRLMSLVRFFFLDMVFAVDRSHRHPGAASARHVEVDARSLPSRLVDLLTFGFREAGTWSLDERLKSGVLFALTAHGDDRVVYGFTVDGIVKYIGVCDNTATTLADRLARYQNMAGAGTNRRIAGHIHEELRASRSVRILAWKPDHTLEVGGLKIDLVKGLENPLIDAVQPEWNIHR
jgi:hypothetical protein